MISMCAIVMGAFSTNANADNPQVDIRDFSAATPTDFDCEVVDIDDDACELNCDGPGSNDYTCVCDEHECACTDASLATWTMSLGVEAPMCPDLRRGGGKICYSGPQGSNEKICFKIANPDLCTPCVNGCIVTEEGLTCW